MPATASRLGVLVAVALAACVNADDGSKPSPKDGPDEVMAEIVRQNTPGTSAYRGAGVPKSWDWYAGKMGAVGPTSPPAGFTAVTGWGAVYPEEGAANPPARVYLTGLKTYIRLKTGQWVKVQDQDDAKVPIVGAHFVADFSGKPGPEFRTKVMPDGSFEMASPPDGFNDHFWPHGRGTYEPDTVDGVFVTMKLRTDNPNANLVADAGADWWRDASAGFVADFSNNPGVGINNWVKLTTRAEPLYYTNFTAEQLKANPPPLD